MFLAIADLCMRQYYSQMGIQQSAFLCGGAVPHFLYLDVLLGLWLCAEGREPHPSYSFCEEVSCGGKFPD